MENNDVIETPADDNAKVSLKDLTPSRLMSRLLAKKPDIPVAAFNSSL